MVEGDWVLTWPGGLSHPSSVLWLIDMAPSLGANRPRLAGVVAMVTVLAAQKLGSRRADTHSHARGEVPTCGEIGPHSSPG